jgi:hypothetical protein
MCKEALGVHADERLLRAERRKEEELHGYRTMRPGKTERDKNGGAWGQRLDNRASRAEENKRQAGTLK